MEKPQRKGMVVKTNQYGDLILCIHKETLISYLDSVPVNEDGWIKHKIRPKRAEDIDGRSRIRHGLEYMPDFPNPIKSMETKERPSRVGE